MGLAQCLRECDKGLAPLAVSAQSSFTIPHFARNAKIRLPLCDRLPVACGIDAHKIGSRLPAVP